MKKTFLMALVAVLTACAAVGPDYVRPDAQVQARFAFAGGNALEEAARDRWWTVLNDPVLTDLMEQGLSRNLDLRTAQARIAESAALLRAEGVAASQLSGSAVLDAPRRTFDTDGNTLDQDNFSLNGSFVFNLFGGATRARQQAGAELAAVQYEAAETRLAYQADLAGAVIEARFFQAAIRSTDRTIANRRRILDLTRQLLDSGQLTRSEQVRAQAELSQARADLPGLRNGLHLSAVRIATLLDAPSGPILAALKASGERQPIPAHRFTAGVPADLLRNRPDVLAAEQRLVAAFAGIGIAEARLYPELSLNGTISGDEDEASFLLGPRLSLPVLGRGRLISLKAAAEARAVQAEFAWRSTLRGAVGDVERALVSRATALTEIETRSQALAQFRDLTNLSRETFQLGASTLLGLVQAEQEVQSAGLALARARRDLALAAARLAVATGRGAAVSSATVGPGVVLAVAKGG